MRLFFAAASVVALVVTLHAQPVPAVERAPFGTMPDGVRVEQFTLHGSHGASAKVITLGAILADLKVPDRDGRLASVVREITPSEQGFQRGFPNAAAVFGRVANRVANGKFTLEGKDYQVTKNAGAHHIHGGTKNFSKVVWRASIPDPKKSAVRLSYTCADGEEGYPGKVEVSITYTLTPENTLRLDYEATTDQPTPINLTNHAYFNLGGGGDVAHTELTLNADRYTAADADLIPTGKIESVAGSPLDFKRSTALGGRAAQLEKRRYDHNFVLNKTEGSTAIAFAARAHDPRSGRTMEVWTTEPGVQLYTSVFGAKPAKDAPISFFCLETQHFPDSVNHPNFPSTILRPGQTFHSTTEFRFSAK